MDEDWLDFDIGYWENNPLEQLMSTQPQQETSPLLFDEDLCVCESSDNDEKEQASNQRTPTEISSDSDEELMLSLTIQFDEEPMPQQPTQFNEEPMPQQPTQFDEEPMPQQPTQFDEEPMAQQPTQSDEEPMPQQPTPQKQQRFGTTSSQERDRLLEQAVAENTKKKTRHAVKVFKGKHLINA